MLTPTPGLMLDYLPLAGGGARLVRVYGEQPCIVLPEELPAPQAGGGALPLTELGGYCFSDTQRDPPPSGALCRCLTGPGGAAQLVRAFGRRVGEAGGRGRYSFDFDAAPAEPLPEEPLHPICGRFLEELALPDALRVIGSCAFYNCRSLRRLSIGGAVLTTGSDVFLNDFALTELVVRAAPGASTGLFALVNRITGHVRALFQPEDAGAPQAALWYPEYWEDYEETPAHILLHTFSGQGYHYRQCFLNNAVLWSEYDAVFPEGHDADDPAVMALLCLDRLRYPYQLAQAAAQGYRAFLAAHASLVLQRLLKTQDLDALRALLALEVMDEAAFAEGAALAAKADCAEAAALLADAEHRLLSSRAAAQGRKKRYSFDF